MLTDGSGRDGASRRAVRSDPREVRAAYESFVGSGGARAPVGVDPVVAASWRRSLRNGVDPDALGTDSGLPTHSLEEYRSHHPLSAAMPLVRDLVGGVTDDGLVLAVSDDAGRLLWVEGSGSTRRAADRVGFVEGAVWREERVGTNAPGTALATRRPVQVVGAEHFARPVQDLCCTAAPVHDPATGDLLGVLDLTGGRAAASPVALSLVRATVASVERELAALATRPDAGRAPWEHRLVPGDGGVGSVVEADASPALRVLGRPTLRGRALSLRHAEILLLLAEHPRGLGAEELAVLLHPGDLSLVAVRAEMSRLRRVGEAALGRPLLAGSRPYRLAGRLSSDVERVRDRLARGDVPGALDAYPEPLLRRSGAPGVEGLRAELEAEVRAAVLAADDVGPLLTWVGRDEGTDDHAAWTRLARVAEPGTPPATRARAHLAILDRTLA
ncbi:GAF domain-containing protein [Antribacter gilvus]|uniref:GAF domain-containing protein n=1 Tax=Antribacter gilvus TaxID=2304675 RepID=UPI000F7A2313|nr:GAF domain-containing protein [Antribacter gilvus]